MSIQSSNHLWRVDATLCHFHGRRKVWVRNIAVEDLVIGEYRCPDEQCESTSDYGDAKMQLQEGADELVGYTG